MVVYLINNYNYIKNGCNIFFANQDGVVLSIDVLEQIFTSMDRIKRKLSERGTIVFT